jgi:dTDP-4-dehydrorhamnose reductase
MAEAEARVLELLPSALVIRTSAFFGPWDLHNFVSLVLGVLGAGETFVAADDAIVSPTYVPDLVQASLDLLIDGEQGIWHLANVGAVSWLELARKAAKLAGLEQARLIGRPLAALELVAPRPCYSVLGSERGILLPDLDEGLRQYFHEREPAAHAAGVRA